MIKKLVYVIPLLLFFAVYVHAQNGCTTLGQTPSTAFPICGVDTFHQETVPNCGGKTIPSPCTDGVLLSDLNPFWYKFTCYQSGTLAFLIEPVDQGDDYDWQLFDITGHSPNDVYTDPNLFVACNWSGRTGNTGASPSGSGLVNCAGTAYPTFSSTPTVMQGHDYILLLSHFTTFKPGDAGYSLSFGGGTAVITDTTQPRTQKVTARCDGSTLVLQLNKKMKCASLAVDGSDFIIEPGNPAIQSVAGVGCNGSFDLDSVIIALQQPLAPGNYLLKIKNGFDDNTLLDNCNQPIPVGDSVPFIVFAIQPTPMDSIVPLPCAPDVVQLVFRNPIKCSSIDANGSDFVVTGSIPVNVIGASGANCVNGLSNIINVQLDHKIETSGSFQIALKIGDDGNSIIDECAQETPPNAVLDFVSADTVSADFLYSVGLGCVYDTLVYSHDGRNGVNSWLWQFDVNGISTDQSSYFLFNDYGAKNIKLTVSNGVCTDSSSADILLDNELKAAFTVLPSLELCPEDPAVFTDTSIGKIQSWYWSFGDGTTSTVKNPPPKNYPPAPTRAGRYYPVSLIVRNDLNCYDTSYVTLKVLYSCYIAVPTGFTPNGDGLNDYLYPINAYKADNLVFRIFNRYGQKIFETKDWTKKWDGTINGYPQPSGTYVWMLDYTDRDTGNHYSQKGTTVLIR